MFKCLLEFLSKAKVILPVGTLNVLPDFIVFIFSLDQSGGQADQQ